MEGGQSEDGFAGCCKGEQREGKQEKCQDDPMYGTTGA